MSLVSPAPAAADACSLWSEALTSKVPSSLARGSSVDVGIDEAGRGPVLGPMVYACAFWSPSRASELSSLGFRDSKALTAADRERLFAVLESHAEIGYVQRVLSAEEISGNMLRRRPRNLNEQSHDAAKALVGAVESLGYRVNHVFVDTVGIADKYESELTSHFGGRLQFSVRAKADALYPVVSAASIVAKVTRDRLLLELSESFEDQSMGSGYPSDETTVSWLARHQDAVFGFPPVVRFSWAPARKLLGESADASPSPSSSKARAPPPRRQVEWWARRASPATGATTRTVLPAAPAEGRRLCGARGCAMSFTACPAWCACPPPPTDSTPPPPRTRECTRPQPRPPEASLDPSVVVSVRYPFLLAEGWRLSGGTAHPDRLSLGRRSPSLISSLPSADSGPPRKQSSVHSSLLSPFILMGVRSLLLDPLSPSQQSSRLLLLLSLISCLMAVEVNLGGVTSVLENSAFALGGRVTFEGVNCNVHQVYLLSFTDESSSSEAGAAAVTGYCSAGRAWVDLLLQSPTSKTFLNAGIKSSGSSSATFASLRLGCPPVYEMGGTWTLSSVSSSVAVHGSCNLILSGSSIRKCGSNGWEAITELCYCQSTANGISYPAKTKIGASATGKCLHDGEVTSECSEYGWRRVKGTCADCPAGTFTMNEIRLTIGTAGTEGDRVVSSCPSGYGGGPIVSECTKAGVWNHTGDCLKYSCYPSAVPVGPYSHYEKETGFLGQSFEYQCPTPYSPTRYNIQCSSKGWISTDVCILASPSTPTTVKPSGSPTTTTPMSTMAPTTPPSAVACGEEDMFSGGSPFHLNKTAPQSTSGALLSVTLPCSSGFEGQVVFVCGRNGKWGIQSGKCIPKTVVYCPETVIQQDGAKVTFPSMPLGTEANETCPSPAYTGNVTYMCASREGGVNWVYSANDCVAAASNPDSAASLAWGTTLALLGALLALL